MSSRIHPQARTTPKIRQEIKDSGLSEREAAKVFNISRATASKWLKRDDIQDRSHRAHTLHTTLSATQEAVVLSMRQSLYLPLDDLLYIARQYINPDEIEHRLAPPSHPQTNGMVERFNGRIAELLPQTRFDRRADLETTLLNYLKLYNHHIPQRAIDGQTPVQALKDWQHRRPELFVKRVYDRTGLDT
jgi:IS30 family transposase